MDIETFFEKLGCLYLADSEKRSFKTRVAEYTKLLKKKEKELDKKIDYDGTFSQIVENYEFRQFPNYTQIAKYLKFKPKKADNLIVRTFLVNTDRGEYTFAGYLPPNKVVKEVWGFKVIKEVTPVS